MAYSDPRRVCAPWVTEDKLCCEDAVDPEDCAGTPVPLVYKWTNAEIIEAASNWLYARTCYRYPGACPITIWPCQECNCGCHPCACGTWSMLELPTEYPILSVTEVRLDGVPFVDFRLDRSQWIVRTDGERWPSCNSFDLPNTDSVEIQVDAIVGREPPIELQIAAADLACEMKKACNGDETCQLPPHVRSIARRGVAIEIESITELFESGLTGIQSVDYALKIHGKCGHHGSIFDPTKGFRGYQVS